MSGGETFLINVRMTGAGQVEASGQKVVATNREMAASADQAAAQSKASLGNYAASARKAETSAASLSTRLTATGTTAAAAGKKLTKGLTLPLLGVGAVAAKMSLDFNKSMLLVSTQAGATHKEVEKMSTAILKLSSSGRFAQGPQELSEALFDLESVGFRGSKALDALKASSDLATIGGADLEATTSALAGTLKTGIKGAGNMKDAIGTLNATIGAGKMHMEDLNAAIGTGFLGPAARFGISLTSVGAALAELTAQGVPANSAATRLRMTMSLMEAPTEKAAGALKGIGIGQEDLAKAMQGPKGILGALELLQQHMQGMSNIEQNQVISEAFGGAKSGGTILQLIGKLGDLSKKQREIVKNSGDVGQALKETNEDPAVKFEKDWSALQAQLIQLGNVVIPAITPVIQEITRDIGHAAKAFESLSPATQSWIVKIGLAAAALGPLLSIGGKLFKVFGGVSKAIEAAGAAKIAAPAAEGALPTAAAGLGVGGEGAAGVAAAGLSAPELLAVAAAIAAVTAGLILLYKNSKTFRDEVGQLGDAASHAFGEIEKQIEPAIHAFTHLGNAFSHLHGPIGAVAKIFKGEFVIAVHAAFDSAAKQIKGFGKYFSGMVQVVRGVVELIADLLEGTGGTAWGAVMTIFKGGIKAILGMLEVATAPIRGAAEAIGHGLSGVFSSVWGTIKSAFEGGVNSVIDLLNEWIGLVDKLPFIDIGTIGHIGGGGGGKKSSSHKESREALHHQHRYTGGPITRPTAIVGEEAPQHPEWVIATNPAYRERNLGYWMKAGADLGVPGFAFGGPIGEAVGGAASAVGGAVSGAARDVAGMGVGAVLDALPDPDAVLPSWLAGLGNYLEEELESWVKGKAPKSGAQGPKGVGSFKGVPMANWVIEALQFAEGKGVNPSPTSGYRPASEVISGPVVAPQGHSEHQGTQYPRGAVDFGGPYDPAARVAKMEVVNATAGFKYPLLAPIGFRDDGHASGTGHRKGGILGGPGEAVLLLKKGGSTSIKSSGTLSPEEWGEAMLLGGFPSVARVISEGIGTVKSESSFNASSQAQGPSGHIGGWAESPAFGSVADRLDPVKSSAAARKEWEKDGHSFWQAWGQWEAEQSGLSGGGAKSYGPEYLKLAEHVIAKGVTGAAKPKVPATSHFKVKGGETTIGGGTYAPGSGKVSTAKLNDFGALPNDLHGVRKELAQRRTELQQYQLAYRQTKRKDEKEALMVNMKLLRNRIAALLKQQAKLVEKRRREKVSARIEQRGAFPDLAAAIASDESAYNKATEFTQQVVALEPESFTEAYEQQESAAFHSELGTELTWRNALISSSGHAAQKIAEWEGEIARIEALKAKHPRKYHRQKFRIPALKKAIGQARSTRSDWMSTLGDVQGLGGPSGVLTSLPEQPEAGSFGGYIWDTQMEIRELGLRAKSAAEEATSAVNELLKRRNEELEHEAHVHAAQAPVLAEYMRSNQPGLPEYLGAYETGGTLPRDGFYLGHEGEEVIPKDQAGRGGVHVLQPELHLHGGLEVLAKALEGDIDSRVELRWRKAGRKVGQSQGTPSVAGRRAKMTQGAR